MGQWATIEPCIMSHLVYASTTAKHSKHKGRLHRLFFFIIISLGLGILDATLALFFTNGSHKAFVGNVLHNNSSFSPWRKRFLVLSKVLLLLLNPFSWRFFGCQKTKSWLKIRQQLQTSSPNLLGGKGLSLICVSLCSSHVYVDFFYLVQVPFTSPKHASRWISYFELPKGVNECVRGALWWTGVQSRVSNPGCIPVSRTMFSG